jgi:hypothetical protein
LQFGVRHVCASGVDGLWFVACWFVAGFKIVKANWEAKVHAHAISPDFNDLLCCFCPSATERPAPLSNVSVDAPYLHILQVFEPAYIILQNQVNPMRWWVVVRGTYSVEDILVLIHEGHILGGDDIDIAVLKMCGTN